MRKLNTKESIDQLDADALEVLKKMRAMGRKMARAGEIARKLSCNSVEALGAMERVKSKLHIGGMKTAIAALASLVLVGLTGCANGQWNTGSASTNAALTQAQTVLGAQIAAVAGKVAQGEDPKKALVQASGDAVRSLEGVAITAVQPAITAQLLKWVPKSAQWQGYAHGVAGIVSAYVQSHGNTPAVLKTALEAAALTLNTY